MDDDAKARAKARANWPIVKSCLDDEDDLASLARFSPSERVAMVWQLTLDAWAMSGKPMPTYTRATMPGRLVRRHG